MTSAPKTDEPVDDYAVTVVLDERTVTSGNTADPGDETLGGHPVQDVEAALRSKPRR